MLRVGQVVAIKKKFGYKITIGSLNNHNSVCVGPSIITRKSGITIHLTSLYGYGKTEANADIKIWDIVQVPIEYFIWYSNEI